MTEYKLTLSLTIQGQDDPDAREQAINIFAAVAQVAPIEDMKLQEVFENKPPRGVNIK
jgi:hypothetical protein